MRTFDFHCEACDHRFTDLTEFDETGVYEDVKCPLCGLSERKRKVPSVFGFAFANPEGTDRWNNSTYGHEYRFKHKLPSVLEERRRAEMASHMGGTSDIYNGIDDLNDNDSWGEVK